MYFKLNILSDTEHTWLFEQFMLVTIPSIYTFFQLISVIVTNYLIANYFLQNSFFKMKKYEIKEGDMTKYLYHNRIR